MSSRGAALSFVEMTIECLLSVDGEGSRKDVQDVIFLRRFHCALRSGQRKRSVFFYDKFTTCFALRSFDWICAWESAESGSGEGEVLVQRVDLDDDPVHAEFKFSLQLIPNKGGLSVVHVESGWIRLNAKWSDIGSENRVVAELFSILRRNEYAWGTVDAVVEMKFKRDTFFLIKQDQLFRTLTRELAPNELVPSERFTALEELCRGKEFLETRERDGKSSPLCDAAHPRGMVGRDH
ncbi:unnamed protein product [Toxocara canis]|uniref:MATH domain-containing protein n=1 Tax=Toxocara canis TaxID=6265 RepID=A0A183V6V4_TOXCA|nr:unnamed protein product [Toxocara canis]